MSDIIRWEPVRDLFSMRKEMDRIFNDVFSQPLGRLEGSGTPLVDLYHTDDEIVVKVTMPGVDPQDVDVQIQGDLLTIRGEVKQEEESEPANYHLRERRYSAFARSIRLPVAVSADKSKAEVKNGVLSLTLPKADEVKPKIIQVKAK
ncbi:MAG: Hsp20/alpha crystallin family protein [Anaerolineae bacterium]|nr:Hsp20/alpha crystallin family protein [Anaerolineae bacterium]